MSLDNLLNADMDFVIDGDAGHFKSVLAVRGKLIDGTQSGWQQDVDADVTGLVNMETAEWSGKVSDFTAAGIEPPVLHAQVHAQVTNNDAANPDGVECHVKNRELDPDNIAVVLDLQRARVMV